MRLMIMFACLLQAAFAAPQFVTFKDGKIGVNFGGYHAEAGLGGLLTGNAAHGGLSASAGTPWGQNAAAGLNGQLDGRTAGVAYAGAQATPDVGASAVLGGSVGEMGYIGSEAHANGKTVSKSHSTNHIRGTIDGVPPTMTTSAPHGTGTPQHIQKIKPPKKYSLIKNEYEQQPATTLTDIHNGSGAANVITTKTKTIVRQHVDNANGISVTNANGGDDNGDDDNDESIATVVVVPRGRQQRKRTRQQQKYEQRLLQMQQRQQKRQQQQQQQHQNHHTKNVYVVQPQEQPKQRQQDEKHLLQTPNPDVAHNPNTHTKKLIKSVQKTHVQPAAIDVRTSGQTPASTGIVFNALNIPIGILRSLQETLGGGGVGGRDIGINTQVHSETHLVADPPTFIPVADK